MKEISITVLAVGIAVVGSIFIAAPALASTTPHPPYELIFSIESDGTTELTGAITLACRDAATAEELPVVEILFFLNRSSVDDPSIREREDITVVEVGCCRVRLNLTRRLEGNYTCGKRVDVANVRESLPLTLASLQTIIPLPDPPPQTNFTAVSGDRVVLACPIQPGALIQYYSVIWLKENSIIAQAHRQNISTVDDSRYNIDRATYSLIIDPVNINDTSTRYGCDLFVTDPSTTSRRQLQSSPPVSLILHVIAPPTTPSMEFIPTTPLVEGLPAAVVPVISAFATLVIVIAVIIVAFLVYCAGTRHRRGQSNIYNHVPVPPLPPHTRRMDIYNNSTLGYSQSESRSLDNKFESEHEESGEFVTSQFPSTNPDDSSTLSIGPGPDSPAERANLPLNLATDDRAENPNDEFGVIPSLNVIKNVSYQPSTRFSLERNPAYGTDIAIAPEIGTRANVAYEYTVSVCPSLTTTLDVAVSSTLPSSSMHSIETDLPFERADDGTGSDLPSLNPELGDTTEDYNTGSTENSNNASSVPSPMRIGVSTGPIYANAKISI